MIGKVKLLSNYEEVQTYESEIEQVGEQEMKILGKYPPKEKFVSTDFLFKIKDVKTAWVVMDKKERLINIKINDGDIWTLYYEEDLWSKLKEYFKE